MQTHRDYNDRGKLLHIQGVMEISKLDKHCHAPTGQYIITVQGFIT